MNALTKYVLSSLERDLAISHRERADILNDLSRAQPERVPEIEEMAIGFAQLAIREKRLQMDFEVLLEGSASYRSRLAGGTP